MSGQEPQQPAVEDSFCVDESRNGSLLAAVALGGLAALAGALAWAAIGYYAKLETGYLAWGIGVLVGLAVMRTYRGGGAVAGVLAVLLAVGGIALGKYIMMDWTFTSDAVAEKILQSDDDTRNYHIANGHYLLRKETGQLPKEDIAAVDAVMLEDGDESKLTPAQKKLMDDFYADLAKISQQQKISAIKRSMKQVAAQVGIMEKIKPSLGKMDLVFILLAIITAFKLGNSTHDTGRRRAA